MQGIWVPKLVFANTEQKINTKNDEKAFAVARYMFIFLPIDLIYLMLSLHNFVPNMICAKAPCSPSNRRDAAYAHSDITVLDNIFIFEVSHPPLVRHFSQYLLRAKRIPLS